MFQIPFNHRYIKLGDAFYHRTMPAAVAGPGLIKFNHALADELGISSDGVGDGALAALFSGNDLPANAEPLAMAYAGHQFGHFNPQLGDGRAISLGEITAPEGELFSVQLKGAGRTAYSRNGDGRAALGPVLREYLLSEAMAKLGVPTTRALAAVTTGEKVAREQLLPGGVITRVARSFVRVGTFQYFASRGDAASVKALADYVITHHYADVAEAANPYLALFEAIADGQAALIAQWMQLGFIHGVMNTDNVSVVGETIDYGPCAFIDGYAHDRVYSFIDRHGRYAYSQQPSIGLWNLTRLAEALLPLLAEDEEAAVEIAQTSLKRYVEAYENDWLAGMRAKCGLTADVADNSASSDKPLIETLLNMMAAHQADFTLTFYHLSRLAGDSPDASRSSLPSQEATFRALFNNDADIDAWLAQWRERIMAEASDDERRQALMQRVNPVYIPRNHQIEAVIRAAEDRDDFSLFHDLHEALQAPYTQQAGRDAYMLPPRPEEEVKQTFCGT